MRLGCSQQGSSSPQYLQFPHPHPSAHSPFRAWWIWGEVFWALSMEVNPRFSASRGREDQISTSGTVASGWLRAWQLVWADWPANSRDLFLPPQHWDYKCVHGAYSSHVGSRAQPRTLMLPRQILTQGAVSPVSCTLGETRCLLSGII